LLVVWRADATGDAVVRGGLASAAANKPELHEVKQILNEMDA